MDIRRAATADAPAIASIHVRAWQAAYRGHLPDAFLDRLSAERGEPGWESAIADPEQRVWVAERGGRMIGFASTAPSRDQDAPPGTGELLTIYLEPDVVGTGVGRELFAHAVDDLRARGYRRAGLWVLESNVRTRRFYEAAGWRPDGAAKVEPAGDVQLREVRYVIEL
jgi:L-amino acid N-acyltransferase YncA